jgi:hypothetical protein
VALERMEYSAAVKKVSHRCDRAEVPTAGTDTADPLEFRANGSWFTSPPRVR